MPIDFSHLDRQPPVAAPGSRDVAYLRQRITGFITAVDQRERLHTQSVVALPLGTWNVAVVLQPAQIVLKLSPWSNRFEADFLHLAGTTEARVPRVLGSGTIPDPALPHASYVLMEYVRHSCPAGPLVEQGDLRGAELDALGEALGTTLAQIHGVVVATLRRFDETPADWGACLGLWELTETARFDAELFRYLGFLLERTGYRAARSGTLLHSDANLHNVLVDPQDTAFLALIDPGPLIGGLPMYDLAVASQPWIYGTSYLERIIHGYRHAGGTFDPLLFYTSLLVVAYQQARDYHRDLRQARPLFTAYILPQIADALQAAES